MSEREEFWRELIDWQQRSGLTVAVCCKAEQVSVASFYRWKKLLAEPQMPRRATGRTGVRGSSAETRASHFVPIVVRDDSTDCSAALRRSSDHGNSMRIELPNGVLIHVDANLDGQRLGDLIIAAGQIQSVLPGVAAHGRLQHEVSSC